MLQNNKYTKHQDIIELISLIKKMAKDLYSRYGIIITFNQSNNEEIEILLSNETKILKQIQANLTNNLDVNELYSISKNDAINIIRILNTKEIKTSTEKNLHQQVFNIICSEYLKNCLNELLELHDDITQKPTVINGWTMTSYRGAYLFNIRNISTNQKYTSLFSAINKKNKKVVKKLNKY